MLHSQQFICVSPALLAASILELHRLLTWTIRETRRYTTQDPSLAGSVECATCMAARDLRAATTSAAHATRREATKHVFFFERAPNEKKLVEARSACGGKRTRRLEYARRAISRRFDTVQEYTAQAASSPLIPLNLVNDVTRRREHTRRDLSLWVWAIARRSLLDSQA